MNEYQEKLQKLIRRHENRPRMGHPGFYKNRSEMAKELSRFCDLYWKVTDFNPMEIAQLAHLFEYYKPFSFEKMLLILGRGAAFNHNHQ